MTTLDGTGTLDLERAGALSEALADFFRTTDVGDAFTDDVFFDGHPPFWRFQLQGVEALGAWYRSFAAPGAEVRVVRTLPMPSGFVTELTGRHVEDDREMSDRKIVLCEVRDGRIAELTVYCSGDWDEELRARNAAESPLLRP